MTGIREISKKKKPPCRLKKNWLKNMKCLVPLYKTNATKNSSEVRFKVGNQFILGVKRIQSCFGKCSKKIAFCTARIAPPQHAPPNQVPLPITSARSSDTDVTVCSTVLQGGSAACQCH